LQDSVSPRTEVISIRLPVDIISKLRRESTVRGMGLNSLAKELLTNHANWEEYTRNVPLLPVPPALLGMMLDHFSNDEVTELAHSSGKVGSKQLTMVLSDKFEIDSFLGMFEAWLRGSGMDVSITAGEKYTCLVTHNVGMKWSLFLAGLVESLLKEAHVRRPARFEVKAGSLSFTIGNRHHF
jgi:hypothetical protein